MDQELGDLHNEAFLRGQKAKAKQVAADLFEEEAELATRAAQVASEVIDLADRLSADKHPDKEQVATILKKGLIKALESMQRVGDGGLTVEERKVAVQEARPFFEGSPPSITHSSSGPPPSSGTKALPHEPPKRKRGRPLGSKTSRGPNPRESE